MAAAREAAAGDRDPWIRGAGLRALSRVGSAPEDVLLAREAARSPSDRVRAEGVRALAFLCPEAPAPELLAALAGPTEVVRRSALEGLWTVDRAAGAARAVELLRGLGRSGRRAAVWVLGRIDDPRAADLALAALLGEVDRELLEVEAATLWRCAPRGALGAMGFLRRSSDPRLAEIAEALHSHLMQRYRPEADELERLERSFLEERRLVERAGLNRGPGRGAASMPLWTGAGAGAGGAGASDVRPARGATTRFGLSRSRIARIGAAGVSWGALDWSSVALLVLFGVVLVAALIGRGWSGGGTP